MKTFEEYWRSLSSEQKRRLSKKTGIDYNYIHRIASGDRGKNISLKKALALTRASKKITLSMLENSHTG